VSSIEIEGRIDCAKSKLMMSCCGCTEVADPVESLGMGDVGLQKCHDFDQ
jgi:hypothetical protein